MATLVPTCVPNLWGPPSWECPSCSRAMHATYPWNVTLMGLSSSSGSLLVLRLNVLFTPPAWTPRDLDFSLLIIGVLSGIHVSWPSSVVWVTDARCHITLTLLPMTHQHILVIDVWPLFGTLARVAHKTLAHAAHGTQLTWSTITNSQRRPRTGRYSFDLILKVECIYIFLYLNLEAS